MTTYRCAHGLTLAQQCRECDLELARETVDRFGSLVDEAREVIGEKEQGEVKS
jgi:hypothetical protein